MPRTPRRDLTAEFVRSALDYSPETGVFTWKRRPDRHQRWNSTYAGKITGYTFPGGLQIRINDHCYLAHRLAWLHQTGSWPENEIDHRNGNPHDNRWINLRAATRSQNAQNQRLRADNKSGHKGVFFRPDTHRYQVYVRANGKRHSLGCFDTVDEAAAVYREAAAFYHGEFARYS